MCTCGRLCLCRPGRSDSAGCGRSARPVHVVAGVISVIHQETRGAASVAYPLSRSAVGIPTRAACRQSGCTFSSTISGPSAVMATSIPAKSRFGKTGRQLLASSRDSCQRGSVNPSRSRRSKRSPLISPAGGGRKWGFPGVPSDNLTGTTSPPVVEVSASDSG